MLPDLFKLLKTEINLSVIYTLRKYPYGDQPILGIWKIIG